MRTFIVFALAAILFGTGCASLQTSEKEQSDAHSNHNHEHGRIK